MYRERYTFIYIYIYLYRERYIPETFGVGAYMDPKEDCTNKFEG